MRYVMKQNWCTWTDTCGVDIAGREGDVLIPASTVVIDLMRHADRKE